MRGRREAGTPFILRTRNSRERAEQLHSLSELRQSRRATRRSLRLASVQSLSFFSLMIDLRSLAPFGRRTGESPQSIPAASGKSAMYVSLHDYISNEMNFFDRCCVTMGKSKTNIMNRLGRRVCDERAVLIAKERSVSSAEHAFCDNEKNVETHMLRPS